jgi:hypothetical protein
VRNGIVTENGSEKEGTIPLFIEKKFVKNGINHRI